MCQERDLLTSIVQSVTGSAIGMISVSKVFCYIIDKKNILLTL